MIIFHEGLPGSGKSYESLIEHIIPNLKKGRKIFARINGLNYQKISQLADITEERAKELLIHIEEEQVATIHDHVENDSIVIIDELQNFFPSARTKLSDEMTKFVTEHRHRGIDIIVMGQSLADVHTLWKRRTQRKIQFLKLDMVGQSKRYKWTTFQGVLNNKGDVTFTKLNSGVKKYEEKYFGAYASHQAETENTSNYEDSRANIFKTKAFTVYIPLFLCVFFVAIYSLVDFFDTDKGLTKELQKNQEPAPQREVEMNTHPQQPPPPPPKPKDFIQKNNDSLSTTITYLDVRRKTVFDMIVIWHDSTGRIKDRIYASELLAMGYKLKYIHDSVKVTKGDYSYLYRIKPTFDTQYSLADSRIAAIK